MEKKPSFLPFFVKGMCDRYTKTNFHRYYTAYRGISQ